MNELAGYSLGGYQLEEEIGRGSMGVVYRGKQIALSREVAVKILPQSLAKDASYIARFIREAQIIAGLNHPNIVQIYDAGQQNRILYFVMEFIQGPTLANLLLMDGIIPQYLAAEYGAQIADALDAAYRERFVIHRDIKPENLMLNRWGKIKVMDFGLARATGQQTITIAKNLVGSIYYSSPEQIWGQTLDNRSDIFALGVVLYEMVSGRRPFSGRTMTELSRAIISDKIQPPNLYNPELSPQLELIILRALERDREQRYEEASLMAQELRTLNLQPPALPIASVPTSLALSSFTITEHIKPPYTAQSESLSEREKPLLPKRPQLQRLPHLDRRLDQTKEVQSAQPNEQQAAIADISSSATSHTPIPSINAESIDIDYTDKAAQPSQLVLPSQLKTSSSNLEGEHAQQRQTVKDQIQRLFRLPARKMPQSSTTTDKESAPEA
jgi:serine/threonine protein kinase